MIGRKWWIFIQQLFKCENTQNYILTLRCFFTITTTKAFEIFLDLEIRVNIYLNLGIGLTQPSETDLYGENHPSFVSTTWALSLVDMRSQPLKS